VVNHSQVEFCKNSVLGHSEYIGTSIVEKIEIFKILPDDVQPSLLEQ